jgi:hypothetical protein
MPEPWEKYAKAPPVQEEEGPWSQYGENAPSADAPPPDDRNSIQKSFDTNTSYQPNDPMLKKVLAGTAHGIGMPFVHPIQTAEGLADTMNLSHAFGPNAPAPKPMSEVGKELPYDLGEGFGGMALAEGAGAGLGEGIARIPSTARAGARLSAIEQQAANTPVYFQNTRPALRNFEQHVATGGKGADVMSKLGRRIENIPPPTPPQILRPSRLLGAGTEDIPLHSAPDAPGTSSKPVTLFAPERAMHPRLMAPKVDTPLTENPFHGRLPPDEGVANAEINNSRVGEPFATPEGNPNYGYSDQFPSAEGKWTGGTLRRAFEGGTPQGMGQGEYIGEIPGERGGPGQLQGVLRRPRAFPEGPQPSPENAPIYSNPVNFPEARDFYTNVSDVTRKPGMLRRAFEDAREPRLRYAAGPVREGMNADLTEALKPLNLDEDYNAALREYARGKALKTGLKRAGTAAIGAGAGAAGLGKAHGIVSSVFK